VGAEYLGGIVRMVVGPRRRASAISHQLPKETYAAGCGRAAKVVTDSRGTRMTPCRHAAMHDSQAISIGTMRIAHSEQE
jgi:hypothetical protein